MRTTWTGAKNWVFYEFDADFDELARMPIDEFNAHVGREYPNPIIAGWVREYTDEGRKQMVGA